MAPPYTRWKGKKTATPLTNKEVNQALRTVSTLVIQGLDATSPEHVRGIIAQIEALPVAPQCGASLRKLRAHERNLQAHARAQGKTAAAVPTGRPAVPAAPPARQAAGQATLRLIDALPRMDLPETIQLWRNCLTTLGDPDRAFRHGDARFLLDAIGQEWVRRRLDPVNPDDYFAWPSTDAKAGRHSIDTKGWLPEGMLQAMGYKVGKTEGLAFGQRKMILAEIFKGQLPPLFPRRYLDEWDAPGTATRLRKLAETVASLTRNAKRRRDARMETAIQHWEQDLRFLYEKFYVGTFRFAWPETSF
ncbi:hypothetical protein FHR70_003487 [Microvirga lupini]|uniref:Uncharacterized protein n=1 Tax=Microvirga lupini TaxID=420324 RepID=A0A7W4YXU4_9HYPH|nr:hypothetical protein [Microvirga lupini]MBB3020406.1 hypothetical protein [Microvirga lupini]